MSTEPAGDDRNVGGITLPPLPALVDEGTIDTDVHGRLPSAPTPREKKSSGGLGLFAIGLLAGILGAAGTMFGLYVTWLVPQIDRTAALTSQQGRIDTQLIDLSAQLESLRGSLLKQEQLLGEAREVIAQITLQQAQQLNEAQNAAVKAQNELNSIKLNRKLVDLNDAFQRGGKPIGISQATVEANEVRLTVSYWGYQVTEREALQALLQFSDVIARVFPGIAWPDGYVLTFDSVQNGRRTVYRHGLWEPS
ncbi:MAG: hypothetical protein ABI743_11120 [bacterium]